MSLLSLFRKQKIRIALPKFAHIDRGFEATNDVTEIGNSTWKTGVSPEDPYLSGQFLKRPGIGTVEHPVLFSFAPPSGAIGSLTRSLPPRQFYCPERRVDVCQREKLVTQLRSKRTQIP